MTALSDALALAATAAGTAAALATATAAGASGGSTQTSRDAFIVAVKAAGAALRAAGAPQVTAGLANAALNGWCGRPGSYATGVSKGAEGIEGFSLAGVDTVIWPYELRARTNLTP